MHTKTDDFQAQFRGFFNTPHLFNAPIFGLIPFLDTCRITPQYNSGFVKNLRLGQRVERFVAEELAHCNHIRILKENIQIQEYKRTLGELDCLLLKDNKPIHLEIQFKYYLYDENLGETEIDHCIGPMRRDTLNEKLNKLKTKQFPLLYAKQTQPLLEALQFNAEDFEQRIYFKAQIFLPFGKTISLKTLNPDCIYGFYFNYNDLPKFKDCKFYKPKKVDWLLDLDTNVNWLTYKEIKPQLTVFEAEKYSPLLWLKFPNGEMTKCFVVAW